MSAGRGRLTLQIPGKEIYIVYVHQIKFYTELKFIHNTDKTALLLHVKYCEKFKLRLIAVFQTLGTQQ